MWGLRWVVDELTGATLRLRDVQSRIADQPGVLNYAQTWGSPTVDDLSLTPLEYFRSNCSIGASMLPRHEGEVLQRARGRPDHVGNRFSPRRGLSATHDRGVKDDLFDVPVGGCRAMLGGSAAALYGFDIAALAPSPPPSGPASTR